MLIIIISELAHCACGGSAKFDKTGVTDLFLATHDDVSLTTFRTGLSGCIQATYLRSYITLRDSSRLPENLNSPIPQWTITYKSIHPLNGSLQSSYLATSRGSLNKPTS